LHEWARVGRAVHGILNARDWSPDVLQEIADVFAWAGRPLAEPHAE
jgi:hypothetical protein